MNEITRPIGDFIIRITGMVIGDESLPMPRPIGLFWLDEHKSVIPCYDILAWGKWFEDIDKRRVGLTQVGDFEVSTVFLGMDHNFLSGDANPLFFETMIFQNKNQDGLPAGDFSAVFDRQWRYTTWDEAVAGHERVVYALTEAIKVDNLRRAKHATGTEPERLPEALEDSRSAESPSDQNGAGSERSNELESD